MKNEIVMIDGDKLIPNTMLRTDNEEDTLHKNLNKLETSIRTMRGIKQPLVVIPDKNKYLIDLPLVIK